MKVQSSRLSIAQSQLARPPASTGKSVEEPNCKVTAHESYSPSLFSQEDELELSHRMLLATGATVTGLAYHLPNMYSTSLEVVSGLGGAVVGTLLGALSSGTNGAKVGVPAGLLIGTGVGAILSGDIGRGVHTLAAGVGMGVMGSLGNGKAGPELQSGINTFSDKRSFFGNSAPQEAFATGRVGTLTRSDYSWQFADGGPSKNFKNMLSNSLSGAEPDTFDALAVLTENLPVVGEKPAVVVLKGRQELHATQMDKDGLTLPDGCHIPYSSMRKAIGFADR